MKLPSAVFLFLTLPAAAGAEDFSFFESKIRPVLASSCYDCHAAEKQKGGLRLDWRDGLLKGGKLGPAIVPGDPEKSLLIQAIAHTHAELKMPKSGDALSQKTVDAFREWIRSGAPDPRDRPPSEGAAESGDWAAALSLRKQWWCWQPLKAGDPPPISGVEHPVDRFLRAALAKSGISPSPPADPGTLVRRASLILTGLPPSAEDVTLFAKDPSDRAWNELIDRLLTSPSFGERWARHWMDWLRYADSHGSEGDPAIPHAWQYRDYLIRALNADVPYPQLVKEHIAGDLLPPRLSADGTVNESAIGTAHLRMVFHGFTPTDALDERVTFTDNQVDVVSKTFLALTVSCARCHNHKFDAISQKDYYALYGIFANTRPATCDAGAPDSDAAARSRMIALKQEIIQAIKADWKTSFETLEQRLAAWKPATDEQLKEAAGDGHGPLAAWLAMKDISDVQFAEKWPEVSRPALQWLEKHKAWQQSRKGDIPGNWNGRAGTLTWTTSGHGVATPVASSEFQIMPEGDQVIASVLAPGYTSSRFSAKDRGVVASSPFKVNGGKLWVRASGSNAGVRYVVQNYPRSGLIYPKSELAGDRPRWIEWNLDYWKGESIHIEAWTAPDAPIETGSGDHHSFSLLEVAYQETPGPVPPEPGVPLQRFTGAHFNPASRAELLKGYADTLRTYATCGQAIADASEFTGFFIRAGLLPNSIAELPTAAPLVAEYRRLEKSLRAALRVPGVMEGGSGDQALYIRGDHRKPSDAVPRRFLQAMDATPYQTTESGRRELAGSITGPGAALSSRVAVNRLWHHVFGRGIVATPDNFGKLGELPTHPELLDWLATRFQQDGGSIKKMLKLLLTSGAFRAQSAPVSEAAATDPENKLLSHWTLRRMEAEVIRDSILKVAAKLDTAAGGPPVDGGTPRRSVYVKVIRNDLDPFLTAFDAPVPASTRGKRDVTNVPAQSLTLMNSPLIQSWAGFWADRVTQQSSDTADRIRQLYREAFQREPSVEEVLQCEIYLKTMTGQAELARSEFDTLRDRLTSLAREELTLLEPARRSVAEATARQKPNPASIPKALYEWEFSPGLAGTGEVTLAALGSARVESGALILDGNGHVSSQPLPVTLREKTLEAWVSLDTLDQAGGGVITIQDLSGGTFDAVVFAEKDPRQWVAGSNVFARTQTLGGAAEADAAHQAVHVAITWAGDGTIAAYRNGQPYGKPYKSNGPVIFEAGKSQILLGCRHGNPEGNRTLKGRIHRARVYDRALSSAEIAATATLEGISVSHTAILSALTKEQRSRYDELCAARDEIHRAQDDLKGLEQSAVARPWSSLALALINTKEFIYVR